MIGEFYDYLMETMKDGNMCLQLNGKRIVSRDVETLLHMATNSSVPENILEKFKSLNIKAKASDGWKDFSKEVLTIMTNDWVEEARYGVDFAYTEMTNYVNWLVS